MKAKTSGNPTDPKKKIFAKSRSVTQAAPEKVASAVDANPDYVFQGGSLDEAEVVEKAAVNPEYPYYMQLTNEEKSSFWDESPIGRAIRHKAREGKAFNSQDAKDLVSALTIGPLSTMGQVLSTPAAFVAEGLHQLDNKPYNYLNALPSLSYGGTQRFPSSAFEKELSNVEEKSGIPKWGLGLAVDIVADPLSWTPLSLLKSSRLAKGVRAAKAIDSGESVASNAVRTQIGESAAKGATTEVASFNDVLKAYSKPVLKSKQINAGNTFIVPKISRDVPDALISFDLIDGDQGNVIGTVGGFKLSDFELNDASKILNNADNYSGFELGDLSEEAYNSIYKKIYDGKNDGTFKYLHLGYKSFDVNPFTPKSIKGEQFSKVFKRPLEESSGLKHASKKYPNEVFFSKEIMYTDDFDDVLPSWKLPIQETGNATMLNTYLVLSNEGGMSYNVKLVDAYNNFIISESPGISISKSFIDALGAEDLNNIELSYAKANSISEIGSITVKKQYENLFQVLSESPVKDTHNLYPNEITYQTDAPNSMEPGQNYIRYKGEEYSNPSSSEFSKLNNAEDTELKTVSPESVVNSFMDEAHKYQAYALYKQSGINSSLVNKLSSAIIDIYQGSSHPFNSYTSKFDKEISKSGKVLRKEVSKDLENIIKAQERNTLPLTIYRGSARSRQSYNLTSEGVTDMSTRRPSDSIYLHVAPGQKVKMSLSEITTDYIGKDFSLNAFGSYSLNPKTAMSFSERSNEFYENVEMLNMLKALGKENNFMPYKFDNPGTLLEVNMVDSPVFFVPAHSFGTLNSELEVILRRGAILRIDDVIGGASYDDISKVVKDKSALAKHKKDVNAEMMRLADDFISKKSKNIDDYIDEFYPDETEKRREELKKTIETGLRLDSHRRTVQGAETPFAIIKATLVKPTALLPLFFLKQMFDNPDTIKKDAAQSQGEKNN